MLSLIELEVSYQEISETFVSDKHKAFLSRWQSESSAQPLSSELAGWRNAIVLA